MPVADSKDLPAKKQQLLDAAIAAFLQQGYSATSVDEICKAAGVTKGSFFYYFEDKVAIARETMAAWAAMGQQLFSPVLEPSDPVERVRSFFDTMIAILKDPDTPKSCLIGTLTQEMASANEGVREHCKCHFDQWTQWLESLLRAAAEDREVELDAAETAWFITSVQQGSMLIAKAKQDPSFIIRNIERCRDDVLQQLEAKH